MTRAPCSDSAHLPFPPEGWGAGSCLADDTPAPLAWPAHVEARLDRLERRRLMAAVGHGVALSAVVLVGLAWLDRRDP